MPTRTNDPETNLYTDQQFVVVTKDLFMAGAETTSNSLEFGILYLMQNPEIQQRIQAEIDIAVGNNRFPSMSDKPRIPFTEATILEILRFSSVTPVDARAAKTNTTRGYTIPAGTMAIINFRALHMSEKMWKGPLKFRSWRFLNSDSQVINADRIMPFGGGKRICLGQKLAMATMLMYLTTMLQKFTFEEAPSHPSHPLPDSEPVSGHTLSPKPYHTLLKPRNYAAYKPQMMGK